MNFRDKYYVVDIILDWCVDPIAVTRFLVFSGNVLCVSLRVS
jgi:hypothetical protein